MHAKWTGPDEATRADAAAGADGGALGRAGRREPPPGLAFHRPVPAGGYSWWYVDALSDDGSEGLTIIALLGSVFSPYYAWAGREDPLEHAAMNVALYRPRGGSWAMTERGRGDVSRTEDQLVIGPSSASWDGERLVIELAERGFPLPHKIRGRVVVTPAVRGQSAFLLSERGQHRWWPIAPRAHVWVELDEPRLRWSGTGYLDHNWGDGALEDAFHSWAWSRTPLARGAAVLYDVQLQDGGRDAMALRFDDDGQARPFELPPEVALPRGFWGVERATRSEAGARVTRTLTDSHFYVRSAVETTLCGETSVGVHESLDLDRFSRRWAKLLVPFRMPRRARRG